MRSSGPCRGKGCEPQCEVQCEPQCELRCEPQREPLFRRSGRELDNPADGRQRRWRRQPLDPLQQDLGADFERPGQPHQRVDAGHPAAVLDVADLGPVQSATAPELLLERPKRRRAARTFLPS